MIDPYGHFGLANSRIRTEHIADAHIHLHTIYIHMQMFLSVIVLIIIKNNKIN